MFKVTEVTNRGIHVLDTKDNSVEIYDWNTLKSIVEKTGVHIEGVYKSPSDYALCYNGNTTFSGKLVDVYAGSGSLLFVRVKACGGRIINFVIEKSGNLIVIRDYRGIVAFVSNNPSDKTLRSDFKGVKEDISKRVFYIGFNSGLIRVIVKLNNTFTIDFPNTRLVS